MIYHLLAQLPDMGWVPKSWTGIAAIGAVIGFVIAWFSNREFRKKTAKANEGTVNAYERTVAALERQTEAITAERDDYRHKLHAEREGHNACILRIKELELRPDITELFRASERFYGEQSKVAAELVRVVSELANSFHNHDDKVSERMGPVYDSLKSMGEGIQELLRRTDPRNQKGNI